MSPYMIRRRIKLYLKQEDAIRYLLLIACFGLTYFSILYIQSFTTLFGVQFLRSSFEYKLFRQKYSKFLKDQDDERSVEMPLRAHSVSSDVKFVLFWKKHYFTFFYYTVNYQRAFVDRNCSVVNCYFTDDVNYFNGDVTKFDFIVFNGPFVSLDDLPLNRSIHQKYIFMIIEPSVNYPVCDDLFDDFYNATPTYRLDSDIPIPYIEVRNIKGEVVGPKIEMDWIEGGVIEDKNFAMRLKNKTKAVAWFVSHCIVRSERHNYVDKLQKALNTFNLNIDIYGECGPLKCPKSNSIICNNVLKRDYFFYLSFENSFAEDYVTEKLARALQHDVVPIVFGGANYSRFLPPGSYLNARHTTPIQLAATIVDLMRSYEKYSRFFSWKTHYSFRQRTGDDNICAICKALNEKSMEEPKCYKSFRKWWLLDSFDMCDNDY